LAILRPEISDFCSKGALIVFTNPEKFNLRNPNGNLKTLCSKRFPTVNGNP
jgi:hypothetical protein